MNIEISVVTPVFNGERYIRDCIESVLNQDQISVEHIIIDDGSDDMTAEIVNRYPTVKYHSQERSGSNVARNFGISLAKGRYVKFLDSDDFLVRGALAEQYEISQSLGMKEISFGHLVKVKEGYRDRIARPNITETESISDLVLNNILISLPLYPTDAVAAVSGFNPCLHARQEWDLNLRLSAAGYKFKYSDILIFKQRYHDSEHRISNRALDRKKEIEAQRKIYKALPSEKPKEFDDLWAAYLWGMGRQFIYRADVDGAKIFFNEARYFSRVGLEKYLGWKYRLARFFLGDCLPDQIFKLFRRV